MKPRGSSAADLDEAESDRVRRQRCVALESLPSGRLPRGGCQQARVAEDFNLGRGVYSDFNRASSTTPAAGDGGATRHRVSMCWLDERR